MVPASRNVILLFVALLHSPACKKESCTDGRINQGEMALDCGGPCAPCASCRDGKLNQDETNVDCGGSCPVCPTCTDGFRNNGELYVDCGGPCEACITLCTGDPDHLRYMPLEVGNQWKYESPSINQSHTITGTSTHYGNVYFKVMVTSLSTPMREVNLRYNDSGDLVTIYNGKNFLVIPAFPKLHQTWDWIVANTMKVNSINAEVNTTTCQYKNVVELHELDAQGEIRAKYYYAKGVGMVRQIDLTSTENQINLYQIIFN